MVIKKPEITNLDFAEALNFEMVFFIFLKNYCNGGCV